MVSYKCKRFCFQKIMHFVYLQHPCFLHKVSTPYCGNTLGNSLWSMQWNCSNLLISWFYSIYESLGTKSMFGLGYELCKPTKITLGVGTFVLGYEISKSCWWPLVSCGDNFIKLLNRFMIATIVIIHCLGLGWCLCCHLVSG